MFVGETHHFRKLPCGHLHVVSGLVGGIRTCHGPVNKRQESWKELESSLHVTCANLIMIPKPLRSGNLT